jgi:YgiT-type zinc finger domain-containing protein
MVAHGSGQSWPCPRCGEPTKSATVRTTIWRDDQLFVVEDLPAQVCDVCVEQFYDEYVTEALRRLVEDGFASAVPDRVVSVPVFSLKDHIARPAAPNPDESLVDY